MAKWLALVLVLAAAGGWFAWRRWTVQEPVEVRAVRLARGTVTASVVATGKVESIEQTTLRAGVEGRVERVLVGEGEEIQKGAELIRFDRAESENRAAYAKEALGHATLEVKGAQQELDRLTSLSKVDAESKSNLDAAQIRYEKACKQQEMASDDLKLAEIRLAKLRCASPQGCVLIEKKVEDGQWVTPGQELLKVADIDHLRVIARADEADAPRVAFGQAAAVTSDCLPGQRFAAHVTKIAPYAKLDKDAMIVEVTVELDGPTRLLRIGNEVDVRIVTAERAEADWLPVEAVQERDGGPAVWILAGGRVSMKDIRVGITNPTQAEVLSGIGAADVVLIPGDTPLIEKQAVRTR